MDTLAFREGAIARWREWRKQEEDTGEIPLPALDSVIRDSARSPVMSLIAPGLVPGVTSVFVDVDGMSFAARAATEAILDAIEARLGGGRLAAILHQGGFGYEFHFADGRGVDLFEFSEDDQIALWGLLQSLVAIGSAYPDVAASSVEPPDETTRVRTWIRYWLETAPVPDLAGQSRSAPPEFREWTGRFLDAYPEVLQLLAQVVDQIQPHIDEVTAAEEFLTNPRIFQLMQEIQNRTEAYGTRTGDSMPANRDKSGTKMGMMRMLGMVVTEAARAMREENRQRSVGLTKAPRSMAL